MEDTTEVTVSEMNESFDIHQNRRLETAWVKDVSLVNGAHKLFTGRLRWDENQGYDMIWDGDKPEMANRPEFEYVLDSILEDKYGI